jgi:dihydrofolate reductase
MMGKVFVNIAMSLDGYMAPEGMSLEHWNDPGYKNWAAKWGSLMSWFMPLKSFREHLNIGHDGETGQVDDMARATIERIGANVMGMRMFEGGEIGWPEEAPFHCPVFVLTHKKRDPWVRPGGTTFYFVNDGFASAFEQAKAAAGAKDVRIAGGAKVVQQALAAGVVDELEIALAPVIFGGGERLFENVPDSIPAFRIERALHTPQATHLRYVRA